MCLSHSTAGTGSATVSCVEGGPLHVASTKHLSWDDQVITLQAALQDKLVVTCYSMHSSLPINNMQDCQLWATLQASHQHHSMRNWLLHSGIAT